MERVELAIDGHVPQIVEAVRRHGSAVVVAPPGAGKTTRVPPALMALGRVALLQPRRIAARSLARRIALETGAVEGGEVGWQVRFERRASAATRLLVMTEGILTARIQSDPLLSEFDVVVLDEIHERSVHSDLALALARQAAKARGDLRLVVMSATLDAGPLSQFLGGAPVVELTARQHALDIEHADLAPADAILNVMARTSGHVLCFLPGAPEIRRLEAALSGRVGEAIVLPLHGSLDAAAQDAALAPSSRRKIVLATNLAETSLTVDGVTAVVDTGLQKLLRHDLATGIDRLAVERISQDSADQRAGRAGRTGPGLVLRLWDAQARLRPRREPELARVDLAGPLLQVLAWGGDPVDFEWLEPPARDRVNVALELLARLGATDGHRITRTGRLLAKLPLHPRLGRVLIEGGGSRLAAETCAVLSEPDFLRDEAPSSESDVMARLDRVAQAPEAVRRAARELHAMARDVLPDLGEVGELDDEVSLRRALLTGFPDRVARRRAPHSPKLQLVTGSGAVLARESAVREAQWMLALDVQAAPSRDREALVRRASALDPAWLAETSRDVVHSLDDDGVVRATHRSLHGALVLSERSIPPDPEIAASLLADDLAGRGLGERSRDFLARARWAGIEVDVVAVVRDACFGLVRRPDIDLEKLVPHATRDAVSRLAPAEVVMPSGRRRPLEYRADGQVVLSVKLQELFGLAETPRVGARGEPVLLEILSPAGRPVQLTKDLRGFWERGYPEVRRELRARYPKHRWPEDPLTAPSGRARPGT